MSSVELATSKAGVTEPTDGIVEETDFCDNKYFYFT